MSYRLSFALACVVSLLCCSTFAQDLSSSELSSAGHKDRAYSSSFPISIALPASWQSFDGDSKVQGEVLFLQSAKGDPLDATISIATFTRPRSFQDLLRRQVFHLLVEEDAEILVDEALSLKGVKGHKWVYKAFSSKGDKKLYYDLYLLLPQSLGGRLLAFHAVASEHESDKATNLFNRLASSLSWGKL